MKSILALFLIASLIAPQLAIAKVQKKDENTNVKKQNVQQKGNFKHKISKILKRDKTKKIKHKKAKNKPVEKG